MTELGFLIELLTEHKIPNALKKRIVERMKEVESAISSRPPGTNVNIPRAVVLPPGLPPQSPSTLAAMARHQEAAHAPEIPPPPTAPIEIAQTVAAAQALQQRQQILNDAINGQVAVKETGRMTSKAARKF